MGGGLPLFLVLGNFLYSYIYLDTYESSQVLLIPSPPSPSYLPLPILAKTLVVGQESNGLLFFIYCICPSICLFSNLSFQAVELDDLTPVDDLVKHSSSAVDIRTVLMQVAAIPRIWFGSADCDTILSIHLYTFTVGCTVYILDIKECTTYLNHSYEINQILNIFLVKNDKKL